MSPAVLLMAHGSPGAPEEVEPFLRRVMHGRAPTPEAVAQVQARYRAIGGRSPLLSITQAQARALAARLGIPVHVAMRTWHPLIEEVVPRIAQRPIVGVCLAPHDAPQSVGLYLRALEATGAEVVAIRSWATEPLLLKAWAQRICPEVRPDTVLLFTAHSLPVDCAPYPDEVEATIQGILGLLPRVRWDRAWQSCSPGPGDWLAPDVGAKLAELAAQGERRVLVAPVGFVADHIEVLFDLDVLARGAAERVGVAYRRVPMPNDSPLLVEALAAVVRRALA